MTQAAPAAASGGGESSEGGSTTQVTGTAVLTRSDSDFWKAIEADLRAIVGGAEAVGRSIVINRQSGVIMARAMPNELRDVTDYISRTQNTVTRQVILEAKVIEVELNDAYQAGINWAAVLTDGNKQYTLGQLTPPGGFDGNPLAPLNNPVVVAPGNPIDGFRQQYARWRVHRRRELH